MVAAEEAGLAAAPAPPPQPSAFDETGISQRARSAAPPPAVGLPGGATAQPTDVSKLATNRGDDSPRKAQPAHAATGPGRNDPCPCGSGKKYKKCHGAGIP
jgi:hypothetical protein